MKKIKWTKVVMTVSDDVAVASGSFADGCCQGPDDHSRDIRLKNLQNQNI